MKQEETIMKTTKHVLKLLKLKKLLVKEEDYKHVSYNNILQDLIVEHFEKNGIDWKEAIKKID